MFVITYIFICFEMVFAASYMLHDEMIVAKRLLTQAVESSLNPGRGSLHFTKR